MIKVLQACMHATLRVTSLEGILIGLINIYMNFFTDFRLYWWNGELHIPLTPRALSGILETLSKRIENCPIVLCFDELDSISYSMTYYLMGKSTEQEISQNFLGHWILEDKRNISFSPPKNGEFAGDNPTNIDITSEFEIHKTECNAKPKPSSMATFLDSFSNTEAELP